MIVSDGVQPQTILCDGVQPQTILSDGVQSWTIPIDGEQHRLSHYCCAATDYRSNDVQPHIISTTKSSQIEFSSM